MRLRSRHIRFLASLTNEQPCEGRAVERDSAGFVSGRVRIRMI